jgi:hypothetical protein
MTHSIFRKSKKPQKRRPKLDFGCSAIGRKEVGDQGVVICLNTA